MTRPGSPPPPAPALALPRLGMEDLPPGTRRLLADDDAAALTGDGGGGALVIRRVLEDGDGADLAWLFSTLGEGAVADWLAARGGRQLSGRSRRYWAAVLGVETSAPHPLTEELWPL